MGDMVNICALGIKDAVREVVSRADYDDRGVSTIVHDMATYVDAWDRMPGVVGTRMKFVAELRKIVGYIRALPEAPRVSRCDMSELRDAPLAVQVCLERLIFTNYLHGEYGMLCEHWVQNNHYRLPTDISVEITRVRRGTFYYQMWHRLGD